MNATLVLLFRADQLVARSTGSSVWIPRVRVSETMRYNRVQRVYPKPGGLVMSTYRRSGLRDPWAAGEIDLV